MCFFIKNEYYQIFELYSLYEILISSDVSHCSASGGTIGSN